MCCELQMNFTSDFNVATTSSILELLNFFDQHDNWMWFGPDIIKIFNSDHLSLSINQMLFLWEISIKIQSILIFSKLEWNMIISSDCEEHFWLIYGNENDPNQDLKSKMHTISSFSWFLMPCSVSHYEIYNSCMFDVLELVKVKTKRKELRSNKQ